MVATYVLRSNWIKSLRITSQIWLKVLCFLKGTKVLIGGKKGNGLKKYEWEGAKIKSKM